MYSRKWIKMKSREREAYLPGSGNTEGSSNNGSGHGGFPLLMFFPSACILPFMLTVFLSVSCVFCLFSSSSARGLSLWPSLFLWEETGERKSALVSLGSSSQFFFRFSPSPAFFIFYRSWLLLCLSCLFFWFCDPLSLVFSLSFSVQFPPVFPSSVVPPLFLCPVFSVQDEDDGDRTRCYWLMDQNFPWFCFSPLSPLVLSFVVYRDESNGKSNTPLYVVFVWFVLSLGFFIFPAPRFCPFSPFLSPRFFSPRFLRCSSVL
jgi:hypothetical protein